MRPPSARELRRLAGGAGLSLLGRAVNGTLGIVYAVVIARLLDVRSVGVLTLGLTIIKLAELVSRMGLEFGTLHHVAILGGSDPAGVRGTVWKAVRLVLALCVPVTAAVMIAAPELARRFAQPELSGVVRILAASIPAMATTMVFLGALLGLKRFAYNTAGEKLVLPTLNVGLCALLLSLGFGLEGASAAYVAATLVTLPVVAWFFHRSAPSPGAGRTPMPARALLAFSAPLVLVIIFNQLLVWTDTLMLGLLRDASEVGVYGVAARTALVAAVIVGSVNAIFAPTISDLYHREDLAQLEFLFKTVGLCMFATTLPIVMVLVLLAPEVMLVFGSDFAAGATSLSLLAVTQLLAASAGAVGFVLTMSGRQRIMLANTIGACAVNVVLNALLIPGMGMNGAALATCISIAVFQGACLLAVWRTLRIHPYNAEYARVLAMAMAVFAAVALVKTTVGELDYLRAIPLYGLLFGALYLAALAALGYARPLLATMAGMRQGVQSPNA
jgi:O-antigen/teichoic acid export membrane protein